MCAKTLVSIGEGSLGPWRMRIRALHGHETLKLRERRSLYVIVLYTPRIVGPESQHLHHLCRALSLATANRV
jgi:hypothetical protein